MRFVSVVLLSLSLVAVLVGCAGAMSIRPGIVTERTVESPEGATVEKTVHGIEVIQVGEPSAAPPAVQREVAKTGAEVRQNSRAASENLSRAAWVLVSIVGVVGVIVAVRLFPEVVTVRKILYVLGAFAFLSLGACDIAPFKEAANSVVDAPATGVPWLDMAKGAAGLVLAVMGWRASRATVGAVRGWNAGATYARTPFDAADLDEIEAGLVARGWKKPA